MALKSLVLFSLLVLVLLVLKGAQSSWPRETPAQRFQRQHVDSSKGPFDCIYCNQMMRRRNILEKKINTFVHEPLADVQAICWEPNILCKNGQYNCHKSRSTVNITECNLTSRHPNPNYRTINSMRFIIIACSGNPPEPVHYDDSIVGLD